MRRSELKRRTPLKRTWWRRGRSKRSAKSWGHLFPKAGHDPAYRAFARSLGCRLLLVVGGLRHRCWGRMVFAHVKSRGSGAGDKGNGVPLCEGAHDEQGRGTKSFERKYGISLKWEALRVAGEWDARGSFSRP